MSDSEEECVISYNIELIQVISSKLGTSQKINLAKNLLTAKADPNFRDANRKNNTPLHIAIRKNDFFLVRFLISQGASPLIENADKKTPKQLAIQLGRPQFIKLFNDTIEETTEITVETRADELAQDNIIEINQYKEVSEEVEEAINIYLNVIEFDISNQEKWQSIESNIEASCSVGVKIVGCQNVSTSLEFLQTSQFSSTYSKAKYWFMTILVVSETPKLSQQDLKILDAIVPLNRPCLFYWGLPGGKNVKIAYRNPEKEIYVFDFDAASVITEEDLTSADDFDLPLLLTSLKSNIGGKFSGDFATCAINTDEEFDTWRLTDYAARSDDCLSLRLLCALARWDFRQQNEDEKRTLEVAAEYAGTSTLSAILGFPIEIPNQGIRLAERQKELTNTRDPHGDTPFLIAAKKNVPEVLRFFMSLRCGKDDGYKNAVSLAWRNGQYSNVRTLLEEDAPFPNGFSNVDDITQTIARERAQFHEAIENNSEADVAEFVSLNPRLKYAYNVENQSAMTTAVLNKNFQILAFLQSKGFARDDRASELLSELSKEEKLVLKQASWPYFKKDENNYLIHMMTKSSLGVDEGDGSCFDKIRSYYLELDKIPQVSIVLKVLEHSNQLEIVFDFKNETVMYLDPTLNTSETKGSCDYKAGRLYISGVDEEQLIGTLAHELTHLAMQVRFENECRPYEPLNQLKKFEFDEIVKHFHEKQTDDDIDEIIKRVYKVYAPGMWTSELIVRVPHILALYKEQSTDKLDKASRLRNWYQQSVMPDFESFLKNPAKIKSENRIQTLNQQFEVLPDLVDMEKHVQLNDTQLFNTDIFKKEYVTMIQSGYSPLTFLNLYQVLNKVWTPLQMSKNVIFTRASQFTNDITANVIFDAMQSNAGPQLIIDCANAHNERDVISTINSLTNKRNVILITRADQSKEFKNGLALKDGLESVEIKSVKDNFYVFGDLTYETRQEILKKRVKFQGYEVLLHHILDDDSASSDLLPLSEILETDELIVDRPQDDPVGYDQDLYIKRSFNHYTNIDGSIFNFDLPDILSTNEEEFARLRPGPGQNAHLLRRHLDQWVWIRSKGKLTNLRAYIDTNSQRYQTVNIEDMVCGVQPQKIFLVSDVAGMGKTTVLTHISKLIKEKDATKWVSRIELNDFTDLFKKHMTQKFNRENTLKFISEKILKISTPFEVDLFEKSLQMKTRVKVTLLFDGFDEICPTYKNLVLELLQQLEKTEIEQIWITTRPNFIEELEDVFSTIHFSLNPFSKENQEDFLQKYWYKTFGLNAHEMVETFAKALVDKLSGSLHDNLQQVIGMPLQARLLAEIYEEQVRKLIESKATTFALPETLQLAKLFESFVHKKYNIYQREKAKTKSSNEAVQEQSVVYFKYVKKIHQILAMQVVFGKEKHVELKSQKPVTTFSNEEITRIGLVTVEEGKVAFINRAFAEFYVAEFFTVQLTKGNATARNLQQFFLDHVFVFKEYEIIRSFFNGLYVEERMKLTEMTVNPIWKCFAMRDQRMKAMETLIREKHTNIVQYVLTGIHLTDSEGVLKTVLKNTEIWIQSCRDGNIDVLKNFWAWTKIAQMSYKDLGTIMHSIWIEAGASGQLNVLHLLNTWCKELNIDREEMEELVTRAWGNAARYGHIHMLQTIYDISANAPFEAKFSKSLLRHRFTWQRASEEGFLNILEKMKNWSPEEILTNEELKDILVSEDEYVWECAIENGHMNVMEKLLEWCRQLSMSNKEWIRVLLCDNSWWKAAKNGHFAAIEALWQWSKELNIPLEDRKKRLLDEEVWEYGNVYVQERLWSWMQTVNPTKDEFKAIFCNVMNGAKSEEYDGIVEQMMRFGDALVTDPEEKCDMVLKAWRKAAFKKNAYTFGKLWSWIRTFSDEKIKQCLLDRPVLIDVIIEGVLDIQKLLWEFCNEVQLTAKEFKVLLADIWRLTCEGGHLVLLEDLWLYGVDRVGDARFFKKSNQAPREKIITRPVRFNEKCLSDDSWWQDVYSGKKDVIEDIFEWAENLGILDVICSVLEIGGMVGTYDMNKTTLMKDTISDTNEPGFKQRFIENWVMWPHGRLYGYENLRKFWKEMNESPEKIKEQSNLGRMDRQRKEHCAVLEEISKCGATVDMSRDDLKNMLLDRMAWEKAAYQGHVSVLRKLYQWLVDFETSNEDKKMSVMNAMRGATSNGNAKLFKLVSVTGKKLGVSSDEILEIFKYGWRYTIKVGNVSALRVLGDIKSWFNLGVDDYKQLLTDITSWRNLAKNGDEIGIDYYWTWCHENGLDIDKEVYRKILQDKQLWYNAAIGDVFGKVLKLLWKWHASYGFDSRDLKENLLAAWKGSLIEKNANSLDDLWNWGKKVDLSPNDFFRIFSERTEDGTMTIGQFISDEEWVVEALTEIWQDEPTLMKQWMKINENADIA